jgi:hypothetical protein
MSARLRWSRDEAEAARQRIHSALEDQSTAEGLPSFTLPGFTSGHVPFGPAFHAAAVLSRFRLDELRAVTADTDELRQLQAQSIALREEGWRTLAPDLRNAILRELAINKLSLLLDRHAREKDPLQAAIRKVRHPLTPDTLRTMSVGELAALVQVYDGLYLEQYVRRDVLERKLQLARLLEPLRQITRTFSGRTAEMQKLRDYVGVLSTGSSLGDSLRAVGNFIFKPVPKGPFLIHGPGGVGKTTLTAKFILEHALAAEKQFPFAYLDFDRPTVNAEEPPTILIEAVRQIGLQYDSAFVASVALRTRWQARLAVGTTDTASYVRDFVGFLETLEVRDGPVLFVFDTFEEVQRRSTSYSQAVMLLTSQLSVFIPRLRVVIAGRALFDAATFIDGELALEAFDTESAIAYLQNSGVDAETTKLIAARTGGNPLTLTLAIELYRRDPAELRQLDVAKLTDQITQSVLFDRILLHIPDPEVRRLAHPGLVLRRVTPEIIRNVLAKPCGIDVPDLKRAEELFEKLASDSTLVTRVDPRTLVHRSDVRRLMLKPLREHQPAKVEEIHRAAIEFYQNASDVISRAESAYHALSLGETALLTPDLEPLLVNALDELAPFAQVQLAEAYKLELPPETWKSADQESWERLTALKLRQLDPSNIKLASALLTERTERSAHTELMIVESQAYLRMGELSAARVSARRGITLYRDSGNGTLLFRMLMMASEIERQANDFAAADSFLADAEEIARRRNDPQMLAWALVRRADIQRAVEQTVDSQLVNDIAEAVSQLSDEMLRLDLSLVQHAVSHVATKYPELVSLAARLDALDLNPTELGILATAVGSYEVEELLETAPTPDLLGMLEMVLRARFQAPRIHVAAPIPSKNIKLRTAQRQQLRDLLVKHYGGDLAAFLETRYSRGLESVSFAGDDVPRNAMDLVRAAEREGWLNDLIVGLWRSRFLSPDVLAFIDAIGLGPQVRVATGNNAVREKRLHALLAEYRGSIAALEARTCRILSENAQRECGFLVRNNGVATSYLIFGKPALEFDRVVWKSQPISDGLFVQRVRTDVNARPPQMIIEDQFAAQPLERERAAPHAPGRGVVTLPRQRSIDPTQPIFWLWRDDEGTFISGVAKLTAMPEGWFATDAECTIPMVGAPCFDATLNVIGMFVAGSTKNARGGLILPIFEP